MKKTVIIMLLLLIWWSSSSFAALNQKFVLFTNATSVGPRVSHVVTQAYESWGCDITVTGGPAVVRVRIEGNVGASTFDPAGMADITLVGPQLSAGIATIEIANHRVKQIRGNLVTLTGGTNPTVSLNCVGGD